MFERIHLLQKLGRLQQRLLFHLPWDQLKTDRHQMTMFIWGQTNWDRDGRQTGDVDARHVIVHFRHTGQVMVVVLMTTTQIRYSHEARIQWWRHTCSRGQQHITCTRRILNLVVMVMAENASEILTNETAKTQRFTEETIVVFFK